MRDDEVSRDCQLREHRLQAKAIARILAAGDFLSVDELANRFSISPPLSRCVLDVWEAEQRIFSINQEDQVLYPMYAFTPEGELLPQMKDVVIALAPCKDGWGMAFWFGSSNSLLAGKQPRQLLLHHPEDVLAAAGDEVTGVLHG